MGYLVRCTVCERETQGVGTDGKTMPGHGTGWVSCPGEYKPGVYLGGPLLPLPADPPRRDGEFHFTMKDHL